jgi:hypothetical protein
VARVPSRRGTPRFTVGLDGSHKLSGTRLDGRKVNLVFDYLHEAEDAARLLFGWRSEHDDLRVAGGGGPPSGGNVPSGGTGPGGQPAVELDDWGLPKTLTAESLKLGADQVAGMNATMGVSPSTPKPEDPPQKTKEQEREEAAKRQRARSLSEMVGIGWAAVDVIAARKLTEVVGKVPVKVSPKQVNDLADATRDTIVEWFGDRELKPWHMMVLLSLAIPISMVLQSPAKPKPEPAQVQAPAASPPLRAV